MGQNKRDSCRKRKRRDLGEVDGAVRMAKQKTGLRREGKSMRMPEKGSAMEGTELVESSRPSKQPFDWPKKARVRKEGMGGKS